MFCRIYCVKSAWLDWVRITLDRSKLMQIVFLQNFPTQPKPIWRAGLSVLLLVYKGNPKHVFIRLWREKRVCHFLYLEFCTQKLSKVFVALYVVCVNFLWDQEVFAFTYTYGFQSQDWSWELGDQFNCRFKSLKIHKWECLYLLGIQERSSSWTQSCHVIMVVSFLLEVAIGC